VINDDMNILQRATFLNKISSVKTIVKELKNQFDKNNDSNTYNTFINSKSKRGYTSLHYSIVCGHIEIYIFLLKNGADRTIATNSGYNNLILACQTKRTYIFLDEIKKIK
jgi:ankyrin repeat protein